MGYEPHEPISEGLYPRGFRKIFAILLFSTTTILPTVILWQNPPEATVPLHNPGGFGSFQPFDGPPSRNFGHQPFGARSQPASSSNRTWKYFASTFLQLILATIGGFISLALYYPRSGFKRFALLCGPLIGVGSMFTLGVYLAARSEVYKFEIFFAALAGAIPGLALYVLLVHWKANRLAQAMPGQPAFAPEPVFLADPIEPTNAGPPPNFYPRSSSGR